MLQIKQTVFRNRKKIIKNLQQFKIIESIADYKVEKNYQLDKPKGVRGRSSNNELVKKETGWEPKLSLKQGLEKTYAWIYKQLTSDKSNSQKFTRF